MEGLVRFHCVVFFEPAKVPTFAGSLVLTNLSYHHRELTGTPLNTPGPISNPLTHTDASFTVSTMTVP